MRYIWNSNYSNSIIYVIVNIVIYEQLFADKGDKTYSCPCGTLFQRMAPVKTAASHIPLLQLEASLYPENSFYQ